MREKIKELLYPREKPLPRRRFLSVLGWGSLAASLATAVGGLVRFAFPNVLSEPPTRFAVGRPEDFALEAATFLADRRIFIFREKQGFRAMSAICTHLGCTTRPLVKPDNEYDQAHSHCPCHGSVFTKDGTVLKGPAPRPLESYLLTLRPDGQLQVDVARKVGASEYFSV